MRLTSSLAALSPLLVLLGSCVGPGQQRSVATAPPRAAPPRSAPPTRPVPAAVPPTQPAPVATEWQYRPASPGEWRYRPEAAGAVATFGPSVADVRLTLRCDRASRRISLARPVSAQAGAGQGAIIVRTNYGATSWPATTSGGGVPQLVAFRAASDTVLDQIAYSRGKFAVEVAGQQALIVPAWAEVSRVIEDCRG
ncbi:hypothetical protein U5A82_05905 [Sphingobium sp. CR2-8]|uniref:hypothetical protein n=1 Tax=Sphingobium sp. CR2-8 TaxID=1306534 RepID=UPI002DB785D0|nr:hypothetical protein [Sphingobium sp. CR2-8]MEC3910025.1 hypothetical protein [Sphingobium sp. CR2-8]